MTSTFHSTRRRWLAGAAAVVALPWSTAGRAQAPNVAFPYYRGEQALQGLYGVHLPPLARAFEEKARALAAASRQHCSGPANPGALRTAWREARLAWVRLANPAVGPVVTRRSQREIDFWPTRPALLKRAMDSAPRTPKDMERIGGPAKGFPAMELLLAGPAQPAHCPYLALVAAGIEAEAVALREAFDGLARQDWTSDEDATRKAFNDWINQWLGGLENLRWQQVEQPVQRARTAGRGQAPAFARQAMEDNRADWQAQWQSLRAQARLQAGQRTNPPQPGESLLSIEALLLGKGQLALAERWGRAVDAVTAALDALPAQPKEAELMALSSRMKAVSSLYQGQVAAALDVSLGFSSADGD